MIDPRGKIVSCKDIKLAGISLKLKAQFRYVALVLDTLKRDEDYPQYAAIDSLNSMGWCKFDDIKDVLGEAAAKKVVRHCEKKTKEQADRIRRGEG